MQLSHQKILLQNMHRSKKHTNTVSRSTEQGEYRHNMIYEDYKLVAENTKAYNTLCGNFTHVGALAYHMFLLLSLAGGRHNKAQNPKKRYHRCNLPTLHASLTKHRKTRFGSSIANITCFNTFTSSFPSGQRNWAITSPRSCCALPG